MGEKVRFHAIASVPCFELWLLLHFENIQHPIHRDTAFSSLKKHIQDYDKAKKCIFETTKNKLDIASSRAKRLAALYNAFDGNEPYTDVHKLVDLLLNFPKGAHNI